MYICKYLRFISSLRRLCRRRLYMSASRISKPISSNEDLETKFISQILRNGECFPTLPEIYQEGKGNFILVQCSDLFCKKDVKCSVDPVLSYIYLVKFISNGPQNLSACSEGSFPASTLQGPAQIWAERRKCLSLCFTQLGSGRQSGQL